LEQLDLSELEKQILAVVGGELRRLCWYAAGYGVVIGGLQVLALIACEFLTRQ
jgi:uncharacterized membrane protein YheB (UPF0754 family)